MMTVAEINALDREAFVAALGSLFEGSPWIAAEAWPARPFSDLDQLHAALCRVMYAAPPERQVALIRAHPDLVGKAALAGTLTAESTREQAAAGLDRLTPEEIAAFSRYNQAYKEKFGFPFVICARQNKKGSILAGFERRLGNTREQEISAALDEIAKISELRLLDAVSAAKGS
jgi:OHCU decarboxylase